MNKKCFKDVPKGATHYYEEDGKIYFFFMSNHGFRQIKGNVIQFDDAGIPETKIKKLTSEVKHD